MTFYYLNTTLRVSHLYNYVIKQEYIVLISLNKIFAQQLRDRGGEERFIFTSHAWLILKFFDNIAQCTTERPNRTTN